MHLLPRRIRTRADDRGTALVEFAFVSLLFLVLLFGIINMAVLLAFKQNMTQAASESARAAVGIVDDTTDPADPSNAIDERYVVVEDALDSTVNDFDKTCDSNGIGCEWKVHDCAANTDDFTLITEDRSAADACMTVRVTFDNTGDNRIMPAFPLIASLEPTDLSSQTTIRLVPVF